jgi:predicted  nucleic acid-binding Zn-ribbon protein
MQGATLPPWTSGSAIAGSSIYSPATPGFTHGDGMLDASVHDVWGAHDGDSQLHESDQEQEFSAGTQAYQAHQFHYGDPRMYDSDLEQESTAGVSEHHSQEARHADTDVRGPAQEQDHTRGAHASGAAASNGHNEAPLRPSFVVEMERRLHIHIERSLTSMLQNTGERAHESQRFFRDELQTLLALVERNSDRVLETYRALDRHFDDEVARGLADRQSFNRRLDDANQENTNGFTTDLTGHVNHLSTGIQEALEAISQHLQGFGEQIGGVSRGVQHIPDLYKQNMRGLHGRVSDVTRGIQHLLDTSTQGMESLRAELTGQYNDLGRRLDRANANVEILDENIDADRQSMAALSKEVSNITREVAKIVRAIEALKASSYGNREEIISVVTRQFEEVMAGTRLGTELLRPRWRRLQPSDAGDLGCRRGLCTRGS